MPAVQDLAVGDFEFEGRHLVFYEKVSRQFSESAVAFLVPREKSNVGT